MKLLLTFGLFIALSTSAIAQEKTDKVQIVEASCGICQFDMEGKSCELAVRIDGKGYYVEGANLHDQGDPHSADGMCSAIRKAKVVGEIVGDKFVATSFELVEVEGDDHDHKGHKH